MSNPASPETTPSPEIPTEFHKMLEETLSGLDGVEKNIKQLRDFIEKHRLALLMCQSWSAGPTHYPTVTIRKGYGKDSESFNPKEIARAFGAEGWKREKNSYTCGQIDWKKIIDDVHVEIAGAEHMAPKLIEEVKL
jgi:hypothetical protein